MDNHVKTIINEIGNKIPLYREGRKCRNRGCKTILSVYNPNPVCHIHIHEFYDKIDKKLAIARSKLIIATKNKNKRMSKYWKNKIRNLDNKLK